MLDNTATCEHCGGPRLAGVEPVNGLKLCRACQAPQLYVKTLAQEYIPGGFSDAAQTDWHDGAWVPLDQTVNAFLGAHQIAPDQLRELVPHPNGTPTFTLLLAVPRAVAARIAAEGGQP